MNTPSVFFWSITDTSVEYDTSPTDLRSRVLRILPRTIVPAEFHDIHENEILFDKVCHKETCAVQILRW